MNPDFSVEKIGVCRSVNACRGGNPPHCAGNLRLRGNILRGAQFNDRKDWNNANGSRRQTHEGKNHELKCSRSESRNHGLGRPFVPGTYSWAADRRKMAQENSQPDLPEVTSRMSFFEEFAATAQNITHSERRTPIFQNLETKASTSETGLTEPSIQSSFPSPSNSSQDGHKEPHPENWMCFGVGPSPPGAKSSAQNSQERFIRWNAFPISSSPHFRSPAI
jgi:hypothetical protein